MTDRSTLPVRGAAPYDVVVGTGLLGELCPGCSVTPCSGWR
jgi:hypothetical protein